MSKPLIYPYCAHNLNDKFLHGIYARSMRLVNACHASPKKKKRGIIIRKVCGGVV